MKLLLPYAHDINGNLVHIDDAQKGQKFTCPNCGAELLLKISKIPEGQKYHRRNHFAHKGNSDNHCSESFLHKLFKEKCAEYIREKILAQEDLFFEWECEKCNEYHKGNLLKKAVEVVTEYDLGVCKPDIALLDNNGKVIIVIEVIVTHKPEDVAIQHYKDNDIACLQINVEDFSDCDIIQEKLSHPNGVHITLCPNPICKRCGHRMNTATMEIMNIHCWKCNEEVKVAYIYTSNSLECLYLNPHNFTPNELNQAMQLGANLSKKYSKKHKEYYYINSCKYCNEIVEDIKSFLWLFHDDGTPTPPIDTEIKIGYRCLHCAGNGKNNKRCPQCHGYLEIRQNKKGQRFFGCENYPNCTYTKRIYED